MNFYNWKKNDILLLNKFGMPEPIKTKKIIPNIVFFYHYYVLIITKIELDMERVFTIDI